MLIDRRGSTATSRFHWRPRAEQSRNMAREIARLWEGRTSRRLRKKIEMLFAHLKRILKLDRLRLRGPNGARDEFTLAATALNLRKMAKLIAMPTLRPACSAPYGHLGLPHAHDAPRHLSRSGRADN